MTTFDIGSDARKTYDVLDVYAPTGLFCSAERQSVRYMVVDTLYGKSAIQLDPSLNASAFSLHVLNERTLAVGHHLGPVRIDLQEDGWVGTVQAQIGLIATSAGKVFMRCTGPERFDMINSVDLLLRCHDEEIFTKNYLYWQLVSGNGPLYQRGDEIYYPPGNRRFHRSAGIRHGANIIAPAGHQSVH